MTRRKYLVSSCICVKLDFLKMSADILLIHPQIFEYFLSKLVRWMYLLEKPHFIVFLSVDLIHFKENYYIYSYHYRRKLDVRFLSCLRSLQAALRRMYSRIGSIIAAKQVLEQNESEWRETKNVSRLLATRETRKCRGSFYYKWSFSRQYERGTRQRDKQGPSTTRGHNSEFVHLKL